MAKFFNPPSVADDLSYLTDYMEKMAWLIGQYSRGEMVAILGRNNENFHRGGPADEDDANERLIDRAMEYAESRERACNGAYPFRVEPNGEVLRFIEETSESRREIYLYLLLCTRLDMQQNRKLSGLDGTALFEELTAHVLQNYLGGNKRARSMVFGTGSLGEGFQKKVDKLCRALGEGVGFHNQDTNTPAPTGGDGKLDAVAWIPFCDGRAGQLILFAQSKTGTHWRDDVTQLRPDAFIKNWMERTFVRDPTPVFCVAEAVENEWRKLQTNAGILFDRCRMVDFSETVPVELLEKIHQWTAAGKDLLIIH